MHPQKIQINDLMNVQILRLLSGVSVHGDQHLAEVEQDLVQMNVLLDEAIKKLYASFMAIHQAVELQQQALGSLQADSMPLPEYVAHFEALRGEISQHVGAAVTGLQFQDMTSQLIGRMAQHLAGLRDMCGALGADESALATGDEEALQAMLDDLTERVDARVSGLACGVRSTVNQRHMESGDIELF